MGGLAFSHGPNALHTPRMSRALYKYVRDNCQAILRELFVVVATPIEGPCKKDFGDIDIFTTWPKQELFPKPAICVAGKEGTTDLLQGIGVLLRAERCIREQGHVGMFAIPWPKNLPEGIEDHPAEKDGGFEKPRFVQVDVHICPSLEKLEWFLFKHAHGDLWNLLGSTIRPYGLTADEVGLYLRIPEIEKINKKKAKVLLTTNPTEVLSFLGLKFAGSEWEEPFPSMDAVYEYAATCRLFWVKPDSADSNANDDEERAGVEFETEKLKSNDRKRMRHRPMFTNWIEDFLPKCRKQGRFMDQTVTREDVREETFHRFPGVRVEYNARIIEFRKQRQRESMWKKVIKAAIPSEDVIGRDQRGVIAAAFKKIVMADDASFGIFPEIPLKDSDGLYDEDEVRRFVETTWEKVGVAAWAIQLEHSREAKAKKALKRTAAGDEKATNTSVDVSDSPQQNGPSRGPLEA